MQEPCGMRGMAQPWAQLVPPGCDVSPSAASLGRDLPMHQLKNQNQPSKENTPKKIPTNPKQKPQPTKTPHQTKKNSNTPPPPTTKQNPPPNKQRKPTKKPQPPQTKNPKPPSKIVGVFGSSAQDATKEGRERVQFLESAKSGNWGRG